MKMNAENNKLLQEPVSSSGSTSVKLESFYHVTTLTTYVALALARKYACFGCSCKVYSKHSRFIAIMLGRFRMPVWDCMQEYAKMGNSIFGKPRLVSLRNIGIISLPKYSSTALEEAFQEVTARRGEQTANGINVTFPSSWGICKT